MARTATDMLHNNVRMTSEMWYILERVSGGATARTSKQPRYFQITKAVRQVVRLVRTAKGGNLKSKSLKNDRRMGLWSVVSSSAGSGAHAVLANKRYRFVTEGISERIKIRRSWY